MTIENIITTVGIPVIVMALIYIGRKLQVLDTVENKIESIYDRFIKTEQQVETLWKDKYAPTSSPRQLNERGKRILEQSGIKEIVDEKKDTLTTLVREKKPQSAYDTEQVIMSVMSEFPKYCPDMNDRLKDGAFKSGESIETLLFVGGIYLRNEIFTELGFKLDDIG